MKPSKYSADIKITSMEEDDEWNLMSMDRAETRRHFEHNEILKKEGREHEALVENQKRLREFNEAGSERGKTFRKVRGDY
jgi:hypothetical protein